MPDQPAAGAGVVAQRPGSFTSPDGVRGQIVGGTIVAMASGGRCEAPVLLVWGRCDEPAVEVDHVMPWSRGGPTVASNGQALCRSHNRSKGAMVPPWWYVVGLERRRRENFPSGAGVRVLAVMNEEERAARERSAVQRRGRRAA